MIRLLLLLFVSASFGSPAHMDDLHDFHVSRLTINLNQDQQRLEFTLDTFIDDMEAAIASTSQALTSEDVNLFDKMEANQADSLLASYLQQTIKLSINQQQVPVKVLGKEAAEDPYAMYLYMQADLPTHEPVLTGKLTSSFLIDLYDDQQNIVVWQVNGKTSRNDLLTFGRRESVYTK